MTFPVIQPNHYIPQTFTNSKPLLTITFLISAILHILKLQQFDVNKVHMCIGNFTSKNFGIRT